MSEKERESRDRKRVSMWEVVIALGIVGALVSIALPNYREARTKGLFYAAHHMMSSSARYVHDYAENRNPAAIPEELPDSIDTMIWSQSVTIFPADPFDESGENPQSVKGDFDRNGDFISFKGAKLKYWRLSDQLGVIYSHGPDRVDEIGPLRAANEELNVSSAHEFEGVLAPLAFDPTNGVFSTGDLFRVVGVGTKRVEAE